MALTDLLKGAGRVVQAAALGLAVYGCGGAEPGSGGKPKEPTYEGMCQEHREHLTGCGGFSSDSIDRSYQDCLEYCEPTAYVIPTCASIYCSIELRVCDDVKYCSQAVYDCMQDFDSGQFQDDFCHDNGPLGDQDIFE